MVDILRVTKRKARKVHVCNACLWLFSNDYRSLGATISEYKTIIKALRLNGEIQVGEEYEEIAYASEGSVGTYKQKPDIDAICKKYDIYWE